MTRIKIARSPEELTAEWLTAALRESGVIHEASVTSTVSEPVGAGVGFIGQLARVKLTYDRAEAGAPASLIAKLPTLDPGGRGIGNLFRFYEREIRFYEEVAGKGELRVPKRLYSAMDVPGDEFILLIEDLAPAAVGDQIAGCTIEQAELACRSVAKFHAEWWESAALDKLEWMPEINAPVMQSAQGAYQQSWGPFCQMFGDQMSAGMRATGEALQQHIVDIQDVLAQAPRTVNHGDFRGDNMFFGTTERCAPYTLADWQISSKGRGAFDIAYFTTGSLTPADRKTHEMRLLRLWHDALSEHGVEGYAWDQVVLDYRLSVLYSWMYVVIAVGSLDPANERGMALFNAWVQRCSTAVAELDAGALMPG